MNPSSPSIPRRTGSPWLQAWSAWLLRLAQPGPACTTLLDEQQLRDAGLQAASEAQLRDLGLARRPGSRLDTAFGVRRSLL